MPLSPQCAAGYHVLCRAARAGFCACRCHEVAAATPAHRPEYGDTPGWAVPTADPREVRA